MNLGVAINANRNYVQRLGIIWMMIMSRLFDATLGTNQRFGRWHPAAFYLVTNNKFSFYFFWISLIIFLFNSFLGCPTFGAGIVSFGASIMSRFSSWCFEVEFQLCNYFIAMSRKIIPPLFKSLGLIILIPLFAVCGYADFAKSSMSIFLTFIFMKLANRFYLIAFTASLFHFDLQNKMPLASWVEHDTKGKRYFNTNTPARPKHIDFLDYIMEGCRVHVYSV